MKTFIDSKTLIPNYQFGFRHRHSMIGRTYLISTFFEKSLDSKLVCSTILLNADSSIDRPVGYSDASIN